MLDATEQAFIDFIKAGHSLTGAVCWLGFTPEEFEERIDSSTELTRAYTIAKGVAQFKLEQKYMDPDNKMGTRNILTELSNRYSNDWGKPLSTRQPFDGVVPPAPVPLAPSISQMLALGNIEEDEE